MKTRLLIIIVFIFIISILLYVFVMNASGYCDLLLPLCINFGGGSIDHDPDLSPSFALDLDFPLALFYHTILPLVGLGLGISSLFLVPYFILKRKKIPSKPYLSLILAGVLLYFFIPHFVGTLHIFTMIFSQPEQIRTWVFNYQFIFVLIPIIVIVISGITLYKSPVIRKLIKK